MDFTITQEKYLADMTIDYTIKINPRDQIVFCYILEAWEGVFNYSTIDKKDALISVKVPHDFQEIASIVLKYLQTY